MRVVIIGRSGRQYLSEWLNNTEFNGQRLSCHQVPAGDNAIDSIIDGTAQYEVAIIMTSSAPADLSLLRSLVRAVPVVILLATNVSLPFCVQAMRLGAWDYIDSAPTADEDPFDQVTRSVVEACTVRRLRQGTPAARWVHANFAFLANEYAGEWIAVRAVRNETIVKSARTAEDLVSLITPDTILWRMPERETGE